MDSYKKNAWFNIEDINLNNTSLAKILLIFYLIALNSNTLISKQMHNYINDNRYVQHILSFMTMYVLITVVCGNIDTRSAIAYALIGYIWFIFTTKIDIHWNIIIIILLFVGYMFENSIHIDENNIKTDKLISNEHKQKIINENIHKKNLLVGGIIMVTIIGTLLYSNKKHAQYGGSYDIFTYILN